MLQDRDDGLQRDTVGQEQLPGAVLLKGLPVQRLNCGREEEEDVKTKTTYRNTHLSQPSEFLTEDVENRILPEHHQVPHHHVTHQLL